MSSELLSICLCMVSLIAIFLLFWSAGAWGLLSYILIGTVVANVQVLKTAVLETTEEPMVLGTIVFTSLFWAMDLLTEQYGPQVAKKVLYLSLGTPILVLIWMHIAIAYTPLPVPHNLEVQFAFETLFRPAPSIFAASLIAYAISQWAEIWIFSFLKNRTRTQFLGRRALISTAIAGFLDNAIFSTLTWSVWAIQPIPLHTLFWSYILGAYGLRIVLSFGSVPLLYLVRWMQKYHFMTRQNQENTV